MAKKKYNSISDVPTEELKSMMIAFGKEKAKTEKSVRRFLRSIGFDVNNKGEILLPVEIPITAARP